MVRSWLLELEPPYNRKPTNGELRLWWAMIRLAAKDVLDGHESLALDGLEFLRLSGLWLGTTLFQIPEEEWKHEVVALVVRRNRRASRALPTSSLSPLPGTL